MKIAVLSRNPNLYSTRRLVEAGRERGHEVHVIDTLRAYMNIASHKPSIHYKGAEHRTAPYLYPHDFGGYVEQQYLPDSLTDRVYYRPGPNGEEGKRPLKKRPAETGGGDR